jgi:RecA-family ATPase
MDRASGSGVFARDPDALLDLSELEISESLLKQQTDKQVCKICAQWLQRFVDDFDSVCSQDDLESSSIMLESAKNHLPFKSYNLMIQDIENAKQVVKNRTAWRIEGTLREFPKFNPLNLWFDYPIHKIDDAGVLKDCEVEDITPNWKKNFSKKKTNEDRSEERKESIETAFSGVQENGKCRISELAEYIGKSEKTVGRYLKEHGGFWIEEGECGLKAQ